MPGENNQSNNTVSTDSTADKTKNENQNVSDSEKSIPYSRFTEVNSKYKEAKDELAKYQAKEKDENDKKLLEEKKFQELIGNKDKMIKDLESQNNEIKTSFKIENLKSKVSNVLVKNNVIDAEDGLKFVKFDDLIDSDNADDEINKRVSEIVKNKAYLFKVTSQNGQFRSKTENNVPGNQQPSGHNDNGKKKTVSETVLGSLAEKFR